MACRPATRLSTRLSTHTYTRVKCVPARDTAAVPRSGVSPDNDSGRFFTFEHETTTIHVERYGGCAPDCLGQCDTVCTVSGAGGTSTHVSTGPQCQECVTVLHSDSRVKEGLEGTNLHHPPLRRTADHAVSHTERPTFRRRKKTHVHRNAAEMGALESYAIGYEIHHVVRP